jgi:hypothetical protein
MRRHPVLLAALLAACPLSAAHASQWQWVMAPYLWGASVSTDLREDAPPVGSDASFSDLISKLDLAFQGHVEGQGDRFGAFADLTYLDLSDDHDFTGGTAHTSLNTTITEVAAVWNVEPARYEGLDVFFGVRHIVADADVEFDLAGPLPDPTVGMDQSYTDAMVGARYSAKLSEKWRLILRADGSWGDTEGTFNTSVLMGRKFSKGTLLFGYRYMNADIEEAGTDIDLTMHGPMFAYAFGL